jgi:LAS superfamily LD-carboxypeptidase LdcB
MFRDLHPQARPWFKWIYDAAEGAGLRPRITSTYRSMSTQRRLYERYRAGKSIYPAAPPGTSAHNYGLAVDMVVDQPERVGAVWEYWGGSWARWGGRFDDPVHFDIGWRSR